ncbi:MAG: hypothetical protein EAZ43_03455 [Betaproteobacteria bacterium]|nr:MAG: hypothetical protein EAZ43_03455 [Betaproteobacteria bacterium]
MNRIEFSRWASRSLLAALAAVVTFSSLAFADAPGRVGRLAEFAGDVQIANSRESWQPVQRNYPVTAGDNLWVSDAGRAELDVGPLQVWLSGGANVYFERFDDHNLIARLGSGSVAVRIRQWEPKDAMRVITEHGEVSFVQPGLYFVSAGDGYAPSVVRARSGQAELYAGGRVQWISTAEAVLFDQGGARFERAYGSYGSGGFEGWVVARDRRIDRWEQRNRGSLNPWMIGVRDLDEHGYWESSYEYGRIWYPSTVSVGWAPYRNGRWSYVQPWGWTWVDDAPWGFAPFHYGRWVRVGGRWAWVPGQYVGRAVYAPALVTFFGGSGWSVSASGGPSYSWVPLGWNEPFVPWYTYSPNYWRHVNRPYVRNVAEDPWRPPAYVHASVPGAITAVAAATFVGGRHVAQNQIRFATEPDMRSAPPARMGDVVPQFRSGSTAVGRPVDPNPIVRSRGEAQPNVLNVPRPQGPVQGVYPSRERSAVGGVVSSPVITPVQPNSNVAEPRVWRDPNPIVAQPVNPRIQEVRPGVVAPPLSTDNPGARGDRAAPVQKDRRERAPVYEPRSDLGVPGVQNFAAAAPAPQQASASPAVNPLAAAAVGAVVVGGAAIVASQRSAAPAVVTPAAPQRTATAPSVNVNAAAASASANAAAHAQAAAERRQQRVERVAQLRAENSARQQTAANGAVAQRAAPPVTTANVKADAAPQARQTRVRDDRAREGEQQRHKIKEKALREG